MKRVLLLTGAYLTVLVSFVAMPLSSSVVLADAKSDICSGAGANASCKGNGPSISNLLADAINVFSIIIGIASVLMIMAGGFRYITSGGDSGKISGAKDTITYAIVGLVIAAFAQALVRFVLNKVGV